MRTVLSREIIPTELAHAPITAQFSSVGSLTEPWIAEFATSFGRSRTAGGLACGRHPAVKLCFPTVEQVRTCLSGYAAGDSLLLRKDYDKPFLRGKAWYRWDAERSGRDRVMPHIKTYTRAVWEPATESTPEGVVRLAWILLSSANMSAAAWGRLQKNGSQFMVRSYEVGVLFLPSKFEVSSLVPRSSVQPELGTVHSHVPTTRFTWGWPRELFSLERESVRTLATLTAHSHVDANSQERAEFAAELMFPLPHNPLPRAYSSSETPWVFDVPYAVPDVLGNTWPPLGY
jgi:tyrosyl-DNA phosphodiesterase 1